MLILGLKGLNEQNVHVATMVGNRIFLSLYEIRGFISSYSAFVWVRVHVILLGQKLSSESSYFISTIMQWLFYSNRTSR